jgi:AAA family ATPase
VTRPNPFPTQILRVILKDIPHSLTPGNIAAAAQSAHGFVGADLSLAVKEAALLSFRHCQSSLETKASAPSLTRANLEAGLSLVSPSGLREVRTELRNLGMDLSRFVHVTLLACS